MAGKLDDGEHGGGTAAAELQTKVNSGGDGRMGDMVMGKRTGEIIALMVVLGLGLWSVWPAVVSPARVADYGTDGELIAWITNQTVQKISGNFRSPAGQRYSIWDGNIFYPYRNVLGYSDLFMIAALWATLPVWVTGNPAVTAGVGLVVGQLLTMGVVYWWWKELSGNKWGAMAAAVVLGWAQFRWEYQVHLQMWNMQYWLGAGYCFWKWMRTGKYRWGLGSAVLWGLQAWESVLPVYFVAAVMAGMIIFDLRFLANNWKKVLGVAILAGWIMLPVVGMYNGVSREFAYERSIREAAHNGLSVDDTWNWFGSAGIVILGGLAILKIIKTKKFSKDFKWMVVVAITGYVMALGPVLKWQEKTVKIGGRIPIPLPYAITYYLVPGFGSLRTPSRWIWITGWAVSGWIAIAFSKFNSEFQIPNYKGTVGILGALVVATVGGVSLTKYVNLPTWQGASAVYRWIAGQPGQVVLELPAGDENLEHERMMYSLWTKKTLINGSSGFNPPEVNGVKADYVIIHEDQCIKFDRPCSATGQVVWKDENTVVYKL